MLQKIDQEEWRISSFQRDPSPLSSTTKSHQSQWRMLFLGWIIRLCVQLRRVWFDRRCWQRWEPRASNLCECSNLKGDVRHSGTYGVECEFWINSAGDSVQLEIEHGKEQSYKTDNPTRCWKWGVLRWRRELSAATDLKMNAKYAGSFNHWIIGKRWISLGGSLVRMRDPAMTKRKTLRAALIFTALWNPTGPLISLLSIIGWMTAPMIRAENWQSNQRTARESEGHTKGRTRRDNPNGEGSSFAKVMSWNRQT